MSLASHRPRGVAQLLDATFTLYRSNFLAFLTVAVVVIAPLAIVKALVPDDFKRIADFIGNLIVPIGQGAMAIMVAAAVERGETLDAGAALRSIGNRSGSLIAVQIEAGLLVFIGLILLVIPGLIALAWTAVCVPVVVIEQLGYSKAITRSGALAKGHWGHVLGTVILSWALALLLVIGLGTVAGMLGITEGVIDLVSDVLFAVVLPVPAIAMTFLYYDLRVRTESADLDAMITALPANAPH